MPYGIVGQSAPSWDIAQWIGPDGQKIKSIELSKLGHGYKVIYCFQSWCPGCHSHGFPSLKKMVDGLEGEPVAFVVIQTVFEGHEQNGFEKVLETQKRYGLRIPFGHDSRKDESPDIMKKYRTGGTPWFIIIDPQNKVVYNGFHISADNAIATLKELSQLSKNQSS